MKTTLTLRPSGRSGNGLDISDHDHVYQHDVLGLPPGHSASIAEMEGLRWKILRMNDAIQGSWMGDYETAEEALAVLQKEYKHST